ncbi:MAG: hypothetical protein IIA53_09535, partial [Chloroflexi bacterium]|nr:hypothetical protein [Chloroflexota bacterium]
WVDTNEGDLVRLNIIGEPLSEGGLINYTGLARLNTGAIWQQQEQHLTLVERVDELEGQLAIANTALAALTA